MSRATNVAVLGAGSWGTTVASLAARNVDTLVWSRRSDTVEQINREHLNDMYLKGLTLNSRLRATASLEEAVHNCDVLVVGVPSHGFREMLRAVAPQLRPWVPVVSLAKGLEQSSRQRMTQIIHQELPGHPAGLLAGPNIAREVLQGMAAAAVLAMPDREIARALRPVFSSSLFRVYTNLDVIGCELGGPLKNVIAIAAGICDGLELGRNARAALVTRGLAEIMRMGVAMGGRSETFAGLAGLGDLVLTCTGVLSRNRHVGQALGAGRTIEEATAGVVAEGVRTTLAACALAEAAGIEMPIARQMRAVLHEGKPPRAALDELMLRSLRRE